MTKAEIVSQISGKLNLDKTEVMAVVEALMSAIKESMCQGKNIYLRGFGTLYIKKRAEKPGRIISKNLSVIIPAHNIPAFKPAKSFKKKLMKSVPVKE